MTLTGTELVDVIGVPGSGPPSGVTERTTTGAIAALAYNGTLSPTFNVVTATTLSVTGSSSMNTASVATTLFQSGTQYSSSSTTASITASVASISGTPDVTFELGGSTAVGLNLNLPTVATLAAGLPANLAAGNSWRLRLLNSSAGTGSWTVTTNTGWTLKGSSMVVPQNTFRDFYCTLVSATVATLQSVGAGDL